jgi:hypothetical protein
MESFVHFLTDDLSLVIFGLWSLQLAQLGLCINPLGAGFFSQIGLVILDHSLGYKGLGFCSHWA